MEMKRKIITRPCSCRCCMLVIEKTMWEDGDVDYDISLQDSHFDHNYHTLWGRLKRAPRHCLASRSYTAMSICGKNRSSASWWTRWTPWRRSALHRKKSPHKGRNERVRQMPCLFAFVIEFQSLIASQSSGRMAE